MFYGTQYPNATASFTGRVILEEFRTGFAKRSQIAGADGTNDGDLNLGDEGRS